MPHGAIPILTYHSQNIDGNDYGNNDHVALATDLRLIHAAGMKIVPLAWVVDWLLGDKDEAALENAVALTFDDGTDFDVHDLAHPTHGPQQAFLNILREFRYDAPTQELLQATSFVIAGADARRDMADRCLAGLQWMNDDWWGDVQREGLIDIQNHGWDHNHPAVDSLIQKDGISGSFAVIDSEAECQAQVVKAGEFIETKTGRWPSLFAYPFGDSSEFIREQYFPDYADTHRTRAAFGASGEAVTHGHSRWDIPRMVCGFHWRSPEALENILDKARQSWRQAE